MSERGKIILIIAYLVLLGVVSVAAMYFSTVPPPR